MKKILVLFLCLSPAFLWASEPGEKPVADLPYAVMSARPGWEERGPNFIRWLSTSVRVAGASGTMIYYDEQRNEMYVLSAGHLFEQGRAKRLFSVNKQRQVVVFYKNGKKLPQPMGYPAEYLCHVWNGTDKMEDGIIPYDVSLLRFKPDWKNPWYSPIAPIGFKPIPGAWYHNAGCDGMSEVAHYLVQFEREDSNGTVSEYVTHNNTPRGGRSGGGLFTDDGMVIGVTSRASQKMNTGKFTSLQQIHKFLREEGCAFILETSEIARNIPIVDRNGPQMRYPRTFIPLPHFGEGIVLRN